ncbi:MAG: hypothetical protein HQ573_05480 [Desulfobacteraceae bacterium]|nr:hypothetical protein [Desulfobacteraceae bacterium]
MVVTKRTKLSLCQFLDLFIQDVVQVLLDKYDISCWGLSQTELGEALFGADHSSIESLIDEIVRTNGDLRNRVSPRYRFDERWSDFKKCLLLDGYKVEENEIIRIEPFIEANEPVEDDLTKELQLARLSSIMDIIKHIRLSAESFRKSTPDYNGCLSHSRIALETLVREIAANKGYSIKNENKAWGESLAYLKKSSFISQKEENSIASTYTFISDGSHIPVGFTEEEFARFGRNLVTSVCYFIVKKFKALGTSFTFTVSQL